MRQEFLFCRIERSPIRHVRTHLAQISTYQLTDRRYAILGAPVMESNPLNRLQCHVELATSDGRPC